MRASDQTHSAGLFSAEEARDELYSRLADLEAVRRSDLEITRQVSRSGAWYLVHDPVTFRHLRMSVTDYRMLAEIRRGQTLGECFRRLVEQQTLNESDSEQFYSWVVRLNRLGLISLPIDTGVMLHQRAMERQGTVRRARLAGILFYRLPLFSPDAFLRRTVRLVTPLFSRLAVVVWLLAMLISGVYVWQHLGDLSDPFRYASAGQSVMLMALLLVVLKGLHEFGHAYACRYFGGPVPEMGVFFIVFTPCAYVDASASWSFRRRHRRIAVALAGMYFESIAAMGALLLWSLSGPSLVKAAAHQALMLATVVTLGFNINPLMKFDGYYVLADLLAIPNLRNDALYEWKRCVKRVLYGIRTPSRAGSGRGAFGLAFFGCAVAAYKLTVILGISLLVMGLPVIGLPLGLCFILSFIWQTLWKWVCYTVSSRELESCRPRAAAVALAATAAVVGIILYVPSPQMTLAQGVVRHEFRRTLHATSDGQLGHIEVETGQQVSAGQAVCRLTSHRLQEEAERLSAALADAWLRVQAAAGQSPAEYAVAVADFRQQEARYQTVSSDLQSLRVVAPVSGRVIESAALERPGIRVREGEALAVIGHGRRVVDAVISEKTAAGWVPVPGEPVEVCVEGRADRLLHGSILEVSPVARASVPVPALTSVFGGPVELNPETGEPSEAWIGLRVLLDDTGNLPPADGVRAVVKLNAPRPPVGVFVYRSCCRFHESFLMAN